MKKFLLLSIIILIATVLIPKNYNKQVPNQNKMYLIDHEFNFITIFDTSDTCFHQKIRSMINQEYDNFQIYILIDKENTHHLASIKTYAKKEDRSHLIKIIQREGGTPFPIMVEEITKKLHPDSVIISLEKNCLFSKPNTLSILNTIYKNSITPLAIHSNYTHLPSYQANKKPIKYLENSLKTTYAKDPTSTTYYLNIPLYLKITP